MYRSTHTASTTLKADSRRRPRPGSARLAPLAAAAGLAVSVIPQLAAAQALSPISVSGYTQNVIATTSPASASTTATFDAYNGYVFYTIGYPNSDGSSGIPDNGTIVSQSNPNTTFQLAPLQAGTNNVLLFNNAGNATGAPEVSSGTVSLTTPGKFSSLAFLNADANGSSTVTYVLNFAGGATATGTFTGLDWYNGAASAINGLGRVSVGNESGDLESGGGTDNGGDPRLFENDITVPSNDTNLTLDSISFSFTSPGGSQWGLFAVSGATTLFPEFYVGIDPNNPGNDGKADTTSLTFNQNGTASAVVAGQPIVFDDSATGPTAVTVGAAGIDPQSTTFNNSSLVYTLNGGPIVGTGSLSVNNSGFVRLNQVNAYTGGTFVNAGTLTIGSTGALPSGGALNVAAGGTVNFQNSSQVLGALTGPGSLTVNGTALTVGTNTAFSGTIGGTGGSLNIAGGTVSVSSAANISGITGGITVGTGANTASLLISDSSPTAFSGTTLTIGSNGTLGTPGATVATYAGPIVLASTNSAPSTIANDGGQLALPGPVTGSGALSLAGTNGGSFVLSGNNTYNGNTIVTGDPVGSPPSNNITVRLGGNGGFSPNGGLVVNSNSNAFGNLTVDLNGYSPTLQFLNGPANPNYAIVNNGGGLSTLTITNANYTSGSATFGTAITGNIALVKGGTSGNQILTGANTYTGGTTITGGTLTAGTNTALGTGTVSLSGGTLGMAVPVTTTISGFSNFQLNGVAVASGNGVQLTDGGTQEASSVFSKTPLMFNANTSFTASFSYNVPGEPSYGTQADGITFTVQNDQRGASAVGDPGGALGYGGNAAIQQSAAFEYNIYDSAIGFGTDGAVNDQDFTEGYPGFTNTTTITYNAVTQMITSTYTDGFGGPYSNSYSVDLAAVLNGSTGYIGFTGGSGDVTAVQTVSNFTFSSNGANGPATLSNAVTTTPGTVSTISSAVVTGGNVASVGGLNIAAGSTLHIVSVPSSTGTRLVLTTPTLTIDGATGASTGTLDLENNDLVVTNGSVSTVTAEVAQGYNLVGGANWKGNGITSSTAATDTTHLTALGVIQNDQNGTAIYSAANPFDGYAANPGDILVKYTYFGDANLDGKVDGSDYSLIDAGYASNQPGFTGTVLTGWLNGDFNYDGVIDGSDYALIDNAFNNQGASLASQSQVATSTAQVAGPIAVPEPASLGLLALGVTALAGRRRRA
jgi:autotransporter-associated beta strand protein